MINDREYKELKEFAEFYKLLERVFVRRFPICRDCADEGGICPSSDLPCEWPKLPSCFDVVTNTIPTIDIDQLDWQSIKDAAMDSTWIPEEYYQNDWVSDVCNWLRNGPCEACNKVE